MSMKPKLSFMVRNTSHSTMAPKGEGLGKRKMKWKGLVQQLLVSDEGHPEWGRIVKMRLIAWVFWSGHLDVQLQILIFLAH